MARFCSRCNRRFVQNPVSEMTMVSDSVIFVDADGRGTCGECLGAFFEDEEEVGDESEED